MARIERPKQILPETQVALSRKVLALHDALEANTAAMRVIIADGDGDMMHEPRLNELGVERGLIQRDIRELEHLMHVAEILAMPEGVDLISIGHVVELELTYQDGDAEKVTAVLGTEVDGLYLDRTVLSVVSPLGKAIVGKNKGEELTYEAGGEMIKVRVLDFSLPPVRLAEPIAA